MVLVIGAIMLASGRGKVKAHNLIPQRTIDEVRRDQRMIKEKMS
ncbi:MAG: phage holin family protein [Chromatocurvus sp.]